MNFNTWISNKTHKRVLIILADFKLILTQLNLSSPGEKRTLGRPVELFLIPHPRLAIGMWAKAFGTTSGQMMNKFFAFHYGLILVFSVLNNILRVLWNLICMKQSEKLKLPHIRFFVCVVLNTNAAPSRLYCRRWNFSSPHRGQIRTTAWLREELIFYLHTYFVCYDIKDRDKQSSRKSYRNEDVSEFLFISLESTLNPNISTEIY